MALSALMGAPVGNKNATKGARWRAAILRALERAAGGDADRGLDLAATKLVTLAIEGDSWAVDHLANRIDGKPTEVHEHGGELIVRIVKQGTAESCAHAPEITDVQTDCG